MLSHEWFIVKKIVSNKNYFESTLWRNSDIWCKWCLKLCSLSNSLLWVICCSQVVSNYSESMLHKGYTICICDPGFKSVSPQNSIFCAVYQNKVFES
jgi:hypothetical protein